MGLERDIEVDCGAVRWVTKVLPVFRDGFPGVLGVHVAPVWW